MFEISKGDKKEYEMGILWNVNSSFDIEFNNYINKYEFNQFDIEDTERIRHINKIKKNSSFYLVCLEWIVNKKINEEYNEIYYEKILVLIRYYGTNIIILPGGSIKNINYEQKGNIPTNIILLLTKNALIPIPIKYNFSIKTQNKFSNKLTAQQLVYKIDEKIKKYNFFLDMEIKNAGPTVQCDICFASYMASGLMEFTPIITIGLNKLNKRILLADSNENIWENNTLIDNYKEKLINLAGDFSSNIAGKKLHINFNIMYETVSNINIKDYLPFWLFTFGDNLFLVLMTICFGAYGLSNNISLDNLLSHIQNNDGIRIQANSNNIFINPILFLHGEAKSGKTTTIVIILTTMYGLLQNKLVFNQEFTKASVSKNCYKLGSLTVLHDDVLQKIFRSGSSLAKFIMCIASRFESQIASEKNIRGIRNASILTAEEDIFDSSKLDVATHVKGPYSRLLSFFWKKIPHTIAFWNKINNYLTNLLACVQCHWSQCKWTLNKKVVKYLNKTLLLHFGKDKYNKFIKSSRPYSQIQKFISFIYNYVLDFMWIRYDTKNLKNCKIMKLSIKHIITFFKNSLIQA